MKRPYLIVVPAERPKERLPVNAPNVTVHTIVAVAETETEAIGAAMKEVRRTTPPDEGWVYHAYDIYVMPDHMAKSIAEYWEKRKDEIKAETDSPNNRSTHSNSRDFNSQ